MRILIDECVDERLRHFFAEHECQTARYAMFAGLKNGNLLKAAEQAGFEVLITVDQSLPEQQDMRERRIAVLVLCSRTNRLSDLEPLAHQALAALIGLRPGQVLRIS